MDDTRDIALRAEASARSSHLRLDTINGQIARLGDSHEHMRGDFDKAINDPVTGLRAEVASVKTDVKVHVARLTVLVALVSIVGGAGASALASHYLNQQQHPAPATTAQPVTPAR